MPKQDVRQFLNDSAPIESALAYASYRFHIFPVVEGDKQPATGRGGFKNCTANPEKIKSWWAKNPNYNIGIALRYSTLAVVDVDPRNKGDETLADLESRFSKLPPTFTVRTGSGGYHFYYRVPDDSWYDDHDIAKQLGPGLDFLTNGYAVAPPSRLRNGDMYVVTKGELVEGDFARVPTSWLHDVTDYQKLRKYDSWNPDEQDWFIEEGERDNTLTNVAGILRARLQLNADELEACLRAISQGRIENPDSQEMLNAYKRIAEGVSRYPPGEIHPTAVQLNVRKSRRKPPEFSDLALHGTLGEWVRFMEPFTEAHPAALMMQAIVAFGSVIGARQKGESAPGFQVEDTRHSTALYLMLVGESAKAGKGDSWARVKTLMSVIDPTWNPITGVQTGEGAIQALEDDQEDGTTFKIKHGEEEDVAKSKRKGSRRDRRFFVFEPEFGRPLHAANRVGSTLKDIYRELWDTGGTQKHTAGASQVVSGATVSLVGHITKPELERDFSDVDVLSGFGNRFLYCYTKRTKTLASAPSLSGPQLNRFAYPLADAVDFAREEAPESYPFTPEALKLWEELYPKYMKQDSNPVIDAVTARARPIVRRMAVILAVADLHEAIDVPHLIAADALWSYSQKSAEYIFGSALGSRHADKIVRGLKEHPAGLNKTEITQFIFSGNIDQKKRDLALSSLLDRGIVSVRKEKAGRKTVEVYFIKPDTEW